MAGQFHGQLQSTREKRKLSLALTTQCSRGKRILNLSLSKLQTKPQPLTDKGMYTLNILDLE